VSARGSARAVDPPDGSASIGAGEADCRELVVSEELPRHGPGRISPTPGDPIRARGAEAAVAVVDEERARRIGHARTVTLCYALVMLRLRRPSNVERERLLADARQSSFSYPEAGATRSGTLPAGYRVDHYKRRLGGVGDKLFDRAAGALRLWQAQRGAGVEVYPSDDPVAEAQTVLFLLRAFRIWTIAPCRVVYVVEEPGAFAFAYGTLPGHPERG
jgi:uncharacterized protein (UPF0548 family)